MKTTDNIRSCKRETITHVIVVEGNGTDDDPVRQVSYFYSDDGWLIARRDGWQESQPDVPS